MKALAAEAEGGALRPLAGKIHDSAPPKLFAESKSKENEFPARPEKAEKQFELGLTYKNGKGIRQDSKKAAKWFRKAAGQGHAGAQSALGVMYYLGDGVPENSVLAHMWLNLAAGNGHTKARELLELIAKEMTPEQVAAAQKMAREWKPKK